ncbi:MAG: hypothetical protein WD355_00690 [Balneolaceae bacterium]
MKSAASIKTRQRMEPVLRKVLAEAEIEHRQLQRMFELMGWGELPDELKIEIKDDVRFYAEELQGFYSSCDPHVQRRRESVHFWVHSYLDGLCTLDTAIRSVKM